MSGGEDDEVPARPTPRPRRPRRRRAPGDAILAASIAIAWAPLVVSLVWGVANERWPAGDRSIMGVRVHDVFSRNPPLLGTVSTLGNYAGGEPVHHLGPAQAWALAIPDRVAGGHPAGLLVGGVVLNCACIALALVFVRRRLGAPGVAGLALICVGLAFGLGPTLLRDIWTPYLGLWPFLALMVLVWSLDGDVAALPWAVGVAGFLAQIQLSFVAPAAILAAGGVVGLVLHRRQVRRAGARPRPLGLRLVAGEAVAAAMWAPVAYQQLTGDPGNLTLLVRAMGREVERAGAAFVWNNLVGLLALPPVWLRRTDDAFAVGGPPSVIDLATAFAVALALVAGTRFAWRHRATAPTTWALVATGHVVLLAGLVDLAITPAGGILGLQYRRWMWPFGAFTWFVLAVVGVSWARRATWWPRIGERLPGAAVAPAAVLAVAALAVVPASVGQDSPPSPDTVDARVAAAMWPPLRAALPERPTFVALSGSRANLGIGPEVIRRLVVDGDDVLTAEVMAVSYGEHRVLTPDHRAEQGLLLVSGDASVAPPDPPRRVLAAGRTDGGAVADDLVAIADRLLHRVGGRPGFELTGRGFRRVHERLRIERPDLPRQEVERLLADPTPAMFDVAVLRAQVAGEAERSPLSDEEAAELLEVLEGVDVVAYLIAAPVPADPG